MLKTILIPTDFTVKSLILAKIALQRNVEKKEKIRLILVHGIWLSSSITELLFYSKSKLLAQLETDDFKASCKLLLGKYEDIIDQMSIDLFSGTSQAAFENYIEANHVQEAFISPNYKSKFKNSSSFNLIPYFTKSKIKLIEVNWDSISPASRESKRDELSALFFNHGQVAH